MGSGEADAIKVPVTNTVDWNSGTTTTASTMYIEPYTYGWGQTVYMYQITCPRCKQMKWCQLEHTTICNKCKATLKAVSKVVDYEIPVHL